MALVFVALSSAALSSVALLVACSTAVTLLHWSCIENQIRFNDIGIRTICQSVAAELKSRIVLCPASQFMSLPKLGI